MPAPIRPRRGHSALGPSYGGVVFGDAAIRKRAENLVPKLVPDSTELS
jgi:hypothetical protein